MKSSSIVFIVLILCASDLMLLSKPPTCNVIFSADQQREALRNRAEEVADLIRKALSLEALMAIINDPSGCYIRSCKSHPSPYDLNYVSVYDMDGQTLAHGVPENIGLHRKSHPAIQGILNFARMNGEGPFCYTHETCPNDGPKVSYIKTVQGPDGHILVISAGHCIKP